MTGLKILNIYGLSKADMKSPEKEVLDTECEIVGMGKGLHSHCHGHLWLGTQNMYQVNRTQPLCIAEPITLFYIIFWKISPSVWNCKLDDTRTWYNVHWGLCFQILPGRIEKIKKSESRKILLNNIFIQYLRVSTNRSSSRWELKRSISNMLDARARLKSAA